MQLQQARAQAALEYLTVYGWAILILALAIALLYFYVIQPTLIAGNSCSFTFFVTCQDITLGPNSITHAGILTLLLTNSQQYPIQAPYLFANVNGTNTSKVACSPGFVPSGGSLFCQLTVANSISLNQYISGKIYLNASYCGLGANLTSITSCSSPITQTFVGTFGAHAQKAASSSNVVVALSVASSAATNVPVTLSAAVTFLSTNIAGAPVNFTESSSTPLLYPQYATTNPSGIAYSTIKSNAPITVTVTASSFGVSASNTITFTYTPPPTSTTTTTTTSTTSLPACSCGVCYNLHYFCVCPPSCPNELSCGTLKYGCTT